MEAVTNIPWKELDNDSFEICCQILISKVDLTNEVFVCFLKELVLSQLLKEGPLNRGLDVLISAIVAARPHASLSGLILPLLASSYMDKVKADMICTIMMNSFGPSLHDEFLKKVFVRIEQDPVALHEPIIVVIQSSLKLIDQQSIGIDTVNTITSVLASESIKQPKSLLIANLILTFITRAKDKLETNHRSIFHGALEKNKSHLKRIILKEISKIN
ncbi:hypothetical protein DSO57_1009838 [Entomophthora muscae]|uniref:Uncharacterized protein n=1 Tax=Entomophthora muscae TaxID=34485 RepID=A0ACC2TUJ5_9FUNG|nr:hypothetical protein DSO57_1009838 [Entomophthora muscae]